MSWLTQTLSSSLGKKVLMSLTGLFLILFLAVHLAGNLQLLLSDEGRAFNIYAHTMANNPLIRIISIGNFIFIGLHVIVSLFLSIKNKKSRPVGYAVSTKDSQSIWASRNMGILGTLILIFIIIHLKGFWYEFKFGSVSEVMYDGMKYLDGYSVVKFAFSNIMYVVLYVVCMVALAFHLSHGFSSAFQTLGLNHKKYTPTIREVGMGFAILVPVLFALIPILMFLGISI